jgi:site-specific DNA-cytosine methylase
MCWQASPSAFFSWELSPTELDLDSLFESPSQICVNACTIYWAAYFLSVSRDVGLDKIGHVLGHSVLQHNMFLSHRLSSTLHGLRLKRLPLSSVKKLPPQLLRLWASSVIASDPPAVKSLAIDTLRLWSDQVDLASQRMPSSNLADDVFSKDHWVDTAEPPEDDHPPDVSEGWFDAQEPASVVEQSGGFNADNAQWLYGGACVVPHLPIINASPKELFNWWDGTWTGSFLSSPATDIMQHLGSLRHEVPGDGHCLFSSLIVALGAKHSLLAVKQLRELLACFAEQNFDELLQAHMPDCTKSQLLHQLRCTSDTAPRRQWGDAKVLMLFVVSHGCAVRVINAQEGEMHWVFGGDNVSSIHLLYDPSVPHYSPLLSDGCQCTAIESLHPRALTQVSQPLSQVTHLSSHCAQSRPIVFIELWAGLGSLSVVASQFGIEPAALLEKDPLLHKLLQARHAQAQTALSFEAGNWKQWSFPSDAFIVVVGGPPCTALSRAGKQLMQHDYQSSYIAATIELALYFGAMMVLIENVPELVTLDSVHQLLSNASSRALEGGLEQVGTFQLRDIDCGGLSQREHVWIQYEHHFLSHALPPWSPPRASCSPSRLTEALIPSELVPHSMWMEGRIELVDHQLDARCATIAAYIHLNEDLELNALNRMAPKVGDLVCISPKLNYDNRSRTARNRWRVLSHSGQSISVIRADRKQPDKLWIVPSSVVCLLPERVALYSTQSAAVTIRRWGEPPLRGGFAILQYCNGVPVARVLTTQELWAAQSLSIHSRESF